MTWSYTAAAAKAARSWEAFDAILDTLKTLEDDETLLVQSGKAGGSIQIASGCPAGIDRQFQFGAALGDTAAF